MYLLMLLACNANKENTLVPSVPPIKPIAYEMEYQGYNRADLPDEFAYHGYVWKWVDKKLGVVCYASGRDISCLSLP